MILPMKNKYIIRSQISEKKFREILKYFAEDIEATKIANLTGISRISINKILKSIIVLMSKECEKISKILRLLSSGHFDNRVCEVLKNPIISGLG